MLNAMKREGLYEELSAKTEYLTEGMRAVAAKHGIALSTVSVGGMFGIFFTDKERVTSFAEATTCDLEAFKKFFHLMLDEGVYLAPSAYEAGFVSAAHTEADLDNTIAAAERAFAKLVA
jgi:glutamate-1-semialdehyde 2,1-aminomutase